MHNVDGKLQIGILTHQKAKSLPRRGGISTRGVYVYKGVRAFFEIAVEYSLQNLPHDKAVLKKLNFK